MQNYDLEKGYIKTEQKVIKHHEGKPENERKVIADYPYDEYELVETYIPYTQQELNEIRINEIIQKLNELSQDFIQVSVGAVIEDIDERKKQFRLLHNELRTLKGKPERIYTKFDNLYKQYKHNMQWYTNYGLCSFSITTNRAEPYTSWKDLLVDGSISLIDYTTVFSESLGFKLICMGKNDGFNLFSGEDVIIDRLFVDNVVNL